MCRVCSLHTLFRWVLFPSSNGRQVEQVLQINKNDSDETAMESALSSASEDMRSLVTSRLDQLKVKSTFRRHV